MTEPQEARRHDDVQENLREIQESIARHKLVEHITHVQQMPRHDLVQNLVHKQHLNVIRRKLDEMHPADIAFILEALPLDDRLLVWDLVKADQGGEILIELSDAVREILIEATAHHELAQAASQLDADQLADLAPDLPHEVMQHVVRSLDSEEHEHLREAMSYPEGSVGALMDFDLVSVREDVSLEVVLRYLRRFDELPDQTDQIFIIDRDEQIRGTLPLNRLLVSDPESLVSDLMLREEMEFHPDDKADAAAQAFERYDLVSAPVVDESGKLIGRVTVDAVVDYIREQSETHALSNAGLREGEDIFASIWDSVKNRWAWLAINLVTAFIASQVIAAFGGAIEKLVALAALMPIVAGIGGNSGNQTITMIVRALALGKLQPEVATPLFRKELGVALINGVIWGGLMGIIAWLLYGTPELGLVMTAAMILNLMLASVVGVAIPLVMTKLGHDPALGSSVLITAMTDSGGFFIFLGLASVFLL